MTQPIISPANLIETSHLFKDRPPRIHGGPGPVCTGNVRFGVSEHWYIRKLGTSKNTEPTTQFNLVTQSLMRPFVKRAEHDPEHATDDTAGYHEPVDQIDPAVFTEPTVPVVEVITSEDHHLQPIEEQVLSGYLEGSGQTGVPDVPIEENIGGTTNGSKSFEMFLQSQVN